MWRNKNERGATAVEYGIIVALIAVAVIAALTAVGGQARAVFDKTAVALAGPAGDQWDDLSAYSCDLTSEQYSLLNGQMGSQSNYTFHIPAKDDPSFPAEVNTVTVAHPDQMKNWLKCGGKPTLFYNHEFQLKFTMRVTNESGNTSDRDVSGRVHSLTYQMAEPRMKGDQLVFTTSAAAPSYSYTPWYDPTLAEETQIEVDKLMSDGATAVEVLAVVKVFDRHGLMLDFQDWGEEDWPVLVQNPEFRVAGYGTMTPTAGNVVKNEMLYY